MENYLENLFSKLFKINGKKKTEAIKVDNKLINNNIPIEDVPLCGDIASVLNDAIVVKALKITALGVLLEMTRVNFPNSTNLRRNYIE